MEVAEFDNVVMNFYQRRSTKDPWALVASSPYNNYRKRRTATDTIFRRRPIDLFASGTARSVRTVLNRDSTVDWERDYATGLYTNYPILSLYPGYEGNLSSHPVNNGTLIEPGVSNISREAMYNKIRSDIHGEAVNLANNLGEYRQTAQLFRDLAEVVATRGRSLIKRTKTGRIGQFGKARYADSVANAHLQWQYGVRPLVSDIQTAIRQIQSGVAGPLEITGTIKRKDRRTQLGYTSSNTTVLGVKARVEREYQWLYKTSYRAKLNASHVQNTLVRSGLANPASLAWELMPYSFVVDWWFNVGEVLTSLDNLLLIDSLEVIDSKSTRTAIFMTCKGDGNIGNTISRGGSAFRYVREDVRTSPTGISVVATPQFKPSLSQGHFLNGLALLQQMRGRSR